MDSIMALGTIFKKATSILGLGSEHLKPPPLDGEIIYCKNNVCVHPPATLAVDSEEHHPGYLTLRSQNDDDVRLCVSINDIEYASQKFLLDLILA